MSSRYLTTGQAAALCSVTPNAVLKWIQAGLLPARRTPGGHHRIDRRDLESFMAPAADREAVPASEPEPAPRGRPFQYCWEFKGRGRLLDGCRECAVFEMRAQRCYEVVKVAAEVGHSRLFCKTTCDVCDYYQQVRAQRTNVLVVTDDEALAAAVERVRDEAPFNVEVTDCEYECSMLVEKFRPDYAVVDCSLGPEASRDICNHLSEDPRIPFVRLILAGRESEFADACERAVFARLEKPFDVDDIVACTAITPRTIGAASGTGAGGTARLEGEGPRQEPKEGPRTSGPRHETRR